MKNVHFAIPEIYGETLSYYELLRKLVDKTNELIDNYNTVPEQIAEEVKNLDASQLFSTVLNQLIHSIATDNTKSANAVMVYKKHDLLYATFNETVNLYESMIDFTTGAETELIVGTNIREVNISELFIELRKLIDINKNNIEAVTAVANENGTEISTIHNDITSIENKNTEQDNEISTLRTMISSPYNFKGDVASISALPASGAVNDTYYVQDVKYKVTWTGSAWVQSSLSEADYQTELSELKGDLDKLNDGGLILKDEVIEEDINNWLNGHPEATTTVQDRSLTIDKMVIGTLGYVTPQMFGAVGDGVTDDTNAFNNLINSLKNYRWLVIPEGIYAIKNRIEFKDINNLLIINKGKFIPISNSTPWIGTITFNNCNNCDIENLTIDGNIDGITKQSGFGTETLLEIKCCKNIKFNNLIITNAHQTAVGGQENTNLSFNNVYFENVGEHGFYFDSNKLNGVYITNLKVKNIGTNESNLNRQVAVFKCRYHDNLDELAKNIHIENFEFTDDAPYSNYQQFKAFLMAHDTYNFSIKNGIIKGETTTIYQTNAALECGTVENINIDGRASSIGTGTEYGDNNNTPIETQNKALVKLINCILYVHDESCFYNHDYYSCTINIGSYATGSLLKVTRDCLIFNSTITYNGDNRIDVQNCSKLTLKNVLLNTISGTQPLFLCKCDCDIIFDGVENNDNSTTRSVIINCGDFNVNIYVNNSVIKNEFHNFAKLFLTNSIYKDTSYINSENVYADNVRLEKTSLTRRDISKKVGTLYAGSSSYSFDFRYNSFIKKIKDDNIQVFTKPYTDDYTVSINNNIVSVTRVDTSNDVTYTVIVS